MRHMFYSHGSHKMLEMLKNLKYSCGLEKGISNTAHEYPLARIFALGLSGYCLY